MNEIGLMKNKEALWRVESDKLIPRFIRLLMMHFEAIWILGRIVYETHLHDYILHYKKKNEFILHKDKINRPSYYHY